jgi:hypothetical protein
MKVLPRSPSQKDVHGLQIGDLVFNCFGQLKPVVEILHRGTDIHGKSFVTFNQRLGENSTMSGSIKTDEAIIFVHDQDHNG